MDKKVIFIYKTNGSKGRVMVTVPVDQEDAKTTLLARKALLEKKGKDFLKNKNCIWEVIKETIVCQTKTLKGV